MKIIRVFIAIPLLVICCFTARRRGDELASDDEA